MLKIYRSYIPFLALLFTVVLVIFGGDAKGQRLYATTERHGHTDNVIPVVGTTAIGIVTDEIKSVNADYTDFTTLYTNSTLGTATAWIQLIFPSSISANKTSFIKISNNAGALLGGEVTVKAYFNSSPVADGTQASIAPPITTLVAPDGSTYLAVTPTATYNSLKITLTSPIALGNNSADIYYAYYEPPNTDCNLALATSTNVSGISVGGNVDSPNNAIDNDLSTYSTLSVGLLGIAASIKQMVYFSSLSNPGDAATVTFSIPPRLLTLGLFDGITLTAYNGPTQVGTPITFSSLLSLDLLFLGGGNRLTTSFIPSGIFDRIEISSTSLASVLGSFYLHEVQRTPPKPSFASTSTQNAIICIGSQATLTANAASPGNELRWYASINSEILLHTGNIYTPSPTTTTTYYVASAKQGCTSESGRVPANVTVNPKPSHPLTQVTSH